MSTSESITLEYCHGWNLRRDASIALEAGSDGDGGVGLPGADRRGECLTADPVGNVRPSRPVDAGEPGAEYG